MNLKQLFKPAATGAIVVASFQTAAVNWDIEPSVTFRETYTDNLFLDEDDKEDDFITEINPALSITGQGKGFSLSSEITSQNIYYLDNSDESDNFFQANLRTNMALLDEWLYLDVDGRFFQRNTSAGGRRSIDNLNITGNRSDVLSYTVSPYFNHNFANNFTVVIRPSFGKVEFDNDDETTNVNDLEQRSLAASINSGPSFTRSSWGINFNASEDEFGSGIQEQRERESISAYFSHQLNSDWSLIFRGGREENDINGVPSQNNGNFYSAGFVWTPTDRFSLEALGGKNNTEATIRYLPTTRTDINVSWRDRDVGLITGTTWSADMSHRTRRSTWTMVYTDSITNNQRLILENPQPRFLLGEDGNPILDEDTGLPLIFIDGEFVLNNDEFRRKRAQLGVDYNTGKTKLGLSVYAEERESIQNNNNGGLGRDQESVGLTASATYQLSRNSDLVADFFADDSEFQETGNEDSYLRFSFGYVNRPSLLTEWAIRLYRTERDGDLLNNNYDENRLMFEFTKRF